MIYIGLSQVFFSFVFIHEDNADVKCFKNFLDSIQVDFAIYNFCHNTARVRYQLQNMKQINYRTLFNIQS